MAFQTNTGYLSIVGGIDTGHRIKVGTSPSIAALPGGGYEVAFKANTGMLWTLGGGDLRLGMMPFMFPFVGANPCIAR